MTRVLPWVAAWFAPSAVLAWILWASGQNPAAALPYGWTGVAGAAGYVIVNGLLERRRRRAFDEDVAAAWLASPRDEDAGRQYIEWTPLDDDLPVTHEGLVRMHEDIARDAERRRDE